ncbi:signal peptidase II [uncultured Algimonas sp.]|uniref:signal peptidase II n=1 Tax=uncultured Algimonas sp. TaxID=1547920 RepID=UPI00262139A0|nr:signal peptidase II [uncultured Algimonas sp.]
MSLPATIRHAIRRIPPLWGLWVPAAIVTADQLSKWAATRAFDRPMSVCAHDPYITVTHEISPVVDLTLLCNQGVSWGLLQGDSAIKRWGLLAFAVVMVFVLLGALSGARDAFTRLCLSLVIGGAVGNAIDRALFGAVTDFVNASDIGFNYVFNLADSAITIGIAGLLLATVRDWMAESKAARQGR